LYSAYKFNRVTKRFSRQVVLNRPEATEATK